MLNLIVHAHAHIKMNNGTWRVFQYIISAIYISPIYYIIMTYINCYVIAIALISSICRHNK